MQDYTKILVWKRSQKFAVVCVQLVSNYPVGLGELRSQIRKCAFSVPANIAEGCGKDSKADFVNFLNISMGSAKELSSHLDLSCELGLIPEVQQKAVLHEIDEIKAMLCTFMKRVKGAEIKR